MTWQTILTILASLSIPSILVSIFLYRQSRKHKKWEAERDLKLKEIELEEEISSDRKEWESFVNHQPLSIKELVYYDFEKSKRKVRKIEAEITYLSKMSGKKPFYKIFSSKSFLEKIKSKKLNE